MKTIKSFFLVSLWLLFIYGLCAFFTTKIDFREWKEATRGFCTFGFGFVLFMWGVYHTTKDEM